MGVVLFWQVALEKRSCPLVRGGGGYSRKKRAAHWFDWEEGPYAMGRGGVAIWLDGVGVRGELHEEYVELPYLRWESACRNG